MAVFDPTTCAVWETTETGRCGNPAETLFTIEFGAHAIRVGACQRHAPAADIAMQWMILTSAAFDRYETKLVGAIRGR